MIICELLQRSKRAKPVEEDEPDIPSQRMLFQMLIELGDKHYIPNAPEKFPVEVRLLGVVLMQTVLFIIMQKVGAVLSNTGGDSNPFMSLISSVIGIGGNKDDTFNKILKTSDEDKNLRFATPTPEKQETKRMKGPSSN
jgi:hypothetical protein